MPRVKKDLAQARAKTMKAWYGFEGPGCEYTILVFATSDGKAQYAVAQEIGLDFLEISSRRCGGYDQYAVDYPPEKAVVFMDNADCQAAGIPDYYSEG